MPNRWEKGTFFVTSDGSVVGCRDVLAEGERCHRVARYTPLRAALRWGFCKSRNRSEMPNHVAAGKNTPRLHGRAERIFVSVDESTGRSTISFQPTGVGEPIQHEDDRTGALAMREAKAISGDHPGSTIHGPHFHGARPPGKKRVMRRPSNNGER
jgi:hypothetical protein